MYKDKDYDLVFFTLMLLTQLNTHTWKMTALYYV